MHAFRAAFESRDAKKENDFRDTSGERVLSGRRLPARTAVTEPILRVELSKDLTALLNSINLSSAEDLDDFPEVQKSILNFGLDDVSSVTIDEGRVDALAQQVARVLRQHEPRLTEDSLSIERDKTVSKSALKVRFLVRAEMVCNPINVPVEFVADFEQDTGQVAISKL